MNLPPLLAGPILRRVERRAIYLWVAMSKRYQISAKVYAVRNNGKDYTLLSNQSETKTIQLGKKLFISLIKAFPEEDSFPSQTLLGYNLTFSRGNEKLGLQDFDLLRKDSPISIVYGNLLYPTFYIDEGKNTKFLYGSCRKLHGKGEDALAIGDLKLSENHLNLKNRPSTLFLTGDQIYADDVAEPIAPFLYELGEELIGAKEHLEEIDERLKLEPFRTSISKVNGRQYILENFANFTSRKASNHLITFGEYAAMYLMSFSPELWNLMNVENRIYPFDELVEENKIHFVFPREDEEFENEFDTNKIRYQEQIEDLQTYHQALPKIRRLLANIPTYMIFDDHDLTDDWNISRAWEDNVSNSALGSHIISNGLSAYWAFQGWGNNPDVFDDLFLLTIWKHFQTLEPFSPSYRKWTKMLLNFDSWHYVAPSNPVTLVLDTRTMRSFTPRPQPTKIGKVIKETTSGPELISKSGWETIEKTLLASEWKSGTPLAIVSAAPLYGIGIIESFLFHVAFPLQLLRFPVRTSFDLEAWKFNGKGYYEFHRRLKNWNPSQCFILSGDAHIASAVKSTITFADHPPNTLYQFTSSPMKNMSFNYFTDFLLKNMIRLYSFINQNEEINRICDETYHLKFDDNHTPSACLLKESIQYLPLENHSIIYTDNNLGMLTISSKTIQNTLLTGKSSDKKEIQYKMK
ncbi:hypothetical protein ACFYKX_19350 [Cytobacillus sp. FJAT-54145]|uniref:PhoD-like phosphatase metallophosphatase domain-containing protein n=1 Tax=Cytobacillus spartinae TaxID=3299023 RepID=A0ABW6KES0_9BACI